MVTGWNGVEVLGSGAVCEASRWSVMLIVWQRLGSTHSAGSRLQARWVRSASFRKGRTEHGDVSTLGQSREKDHTPKGRDGEMPEPERSSRCPPRR